MSKDNSAISGGNQSSAPVDGEGTQGDSVRAAIARSFSRGLALYFARPVRLFRPSKVNGWQTLRNQALMEGNSLSGGYVLSLLRVQGLSVISKHFVPPMLVNALLGTVLWQTYSEAGQALESQLGKDTLAKAAVCGGIAGASQALVAAPAENVRILLQQGFSGHSWSYAWKEVFLTTSEVARTKTRQEIRQLRHWMQEVSQMAGRGWNGWGWGCAKDSFGFATFFLIFEMSRRAGAASKLYAQNQIYQHPAAWTSFPNLAARVPSVTNGVVLVAGGVVAGVAYEATSRPWDSARRVIHEAALDSSTSHLSKLQALRHRMDIEGLKYFFSALPDSTAETASKWARGLRILGRVGPWGVGFLVWEASGQGLH